MYIHRTIEQSVIEKLKSKKILIILGPRQAGKTTLIKHLLGANGVKYLNLDLPRDLNTFQAFSQFSPEEAKIFLGNPNILVIDEAQREPKASRIVKGFWDSGINMKFVLLGSSVLDIKSQAAESLVGRNEKVYLMPFSFEEVLGRKDWYKADSDHEVLFGAFAGEIRTELLSSLVYGSYPESLSVGDKQAFLSNLVEDYIFKDIFNLGLVKSREPIYKLLQLLAGQIGHEVSVNELSASLGLARATVEKYIDLLEETFVLFRFKAFARNQRKEVTRNKKIYFWDTGVRNAILGEFSFSEARSDIGPLWENWVVAEAAKQNLQAGGKGQLYFWRTHAGSEVDLIVKQGQNLQAYEIKWQPRKISNRAFESKYHAKVKLIDSSRPLAKFFN